MILLLLLLWGCNSSRMSSRLAAISTLASHNPDSALAILDSLQPEVDGWDKSDRMRYALVRMKAENKANVVFTSDSLVNVLIEYYKDGSSNDRLLAHYLQGRVYTDMGEAPRAIQCYYDAIEQADTMSRDCDYDAMMGVYGQMADIFYQQNLPQDEIWALRHYVDCVRRTCDTLETVIAEGLMIRPYYALGDKDRVLQIIQSEYQRLKALGYPKEAVSSFGLAFFIYTEREELDKAREVMNLYEKESGFFDEKGNIIVKDREPYYAKKGLFYLRINKVDSAEFFFRKAINSSAQDDSYRGLVEVFRRKRNIDSIARYSQLDEAALDSMRHKVRTDAIRQMSALYNYNRIQKMAEREAEKSRAVRRKINSLSFFTIVVVGSLLFFIYRNQKRKQKRIQMLDEALHATEAERRSVREELSRLKSKDYESLIREKEKRVEELSLTIETLQNESILPVNLNSIEYFSNRKIAVLFAKKANNKLLKSVPTEAEWKMLITQFSKDMPAIYEILSHGDLSPLELRTCILLSLGHTGRAIAQLTGTTSQIVTNAKARANKKLFGSEEAKTLKFNLISALKRA